MSDTSIVISVVCYNNENEVIEFARQVESQAGSENIQLIITCNSTNNYEYLKKSIDGLSISAHIDTPSENMGYLPGCLHGVLSTSLQQRYWLMICNTDLTFPTNDFFKKIFEQEISDIWAIGPDVILKSTGKHQNPFFADRPSVRSMKIRRMAFSNYLLYRIYYKLSEIKNMNSGEQNDNASGIVYAVHGSCFLLNSEVVPLLKEESRNIFMYGEELLVSEIIREHGKKILYNSEAQVIHNENQVTGKVNSRKKQKWIYQSTDYLYSRFFKRVVAEKSGRS